MDIEEIENSNGDTYSVRVKSETGLHIEKEKTDINGVGNEVIKEVRVDNLSM